MNTDDRLPEWPPPPDQPIGIDRAHIAWIGQHVQPALRNARELLTARHPGVAIQTTAVMLAQLASWSFRLPMKHLSIGVVSASVSGGTWAMVDIVITAEGHIEAQPWWNMRE